MTKSVTHFCTATVFVVWSVVLSATSGQNARDRLFNVPDIPEIISMVMFDTNPAYRGRYTAQLPNPEEGTNTGISLNSRTNYPYDDTEGGTQDDIDGDLNLPAALGDRDERLPFSVVRRGEYQPSSQTVKRASLSDLIRRLMALKGNKFTDGRITMMRFGTGRRK